MSLEKIKLPATYNYIGIFLSLACNLSCSYCINHLVGLNKTRKLLNADQWAEALNRIEFTGASVPFTLQGGEPTIHKDFYEIINKINPDYELDLLTNIQFDPKIFAEKIAIKKFNREAPYAPIRVSYHPETMDLVSTLEKVIKLKELGFKVGVFGVLHPLQIEQIKEAEIIFKNNGIDFRTKEFLGEHEGNIFGTYAYEGAVFSQNKKNCLCKTSELLVDPFGDVYRCHHDLYNKINPLGNLLDANFLISDEFRACSYFGSCNPCDVKVKNNRFQKFGHTSVEIILT